MSSIIIYEAFKGGENEEPSGRVGEEGVRMRESDDPVLFHRELVPEAESPWRPPMHVMGLGRAPVHTGNAQCLVCFKRLHCWNRALSFPSAVCCLS